MARRAWPWSSWSPGPDVDHVVGRRPVLEALRAGSVREVLLAAGSRPTAGLRDLLDAADSAGVPVRLVGPEVVEELARGARHQGVAARVRLPRPLSEQALSRREWAHEALVLILDGVTDPHNVGALARTSEAAGADALVLRRRRGAGLSSAAVRASAGALLHLPVVEVANVVRAIERLRDRGFWVIGLDAAAETVLYDRRPPPGPVAVVVGSEGHGVSRLAREACDDLVAIPLRGKVSSLNVSVAAGIALFEFIRPRPGKES
jgi:23S rRNA (guanosine2251-2'-O)-methyltransferase